MLKDYFRIKLKRTPYRSPQKNGVIERFRQTLKKEAFNNVVPINLMQSQRVYREYEKYYDNYRPHHGISGNIPPAKNLSLKKPINFTRNKHLNGKINSYDPSFKAVS